MFKILLFDRSTFLTCMIMAVCAGSVVGPAFALNCKALEPHSGANVSIEEKGKIDGKIDGLFAKLISTSASGDAMYKETRQDVLKDYPNANESYLQDRLIYLKCSSLQDSQLSQVDLNKEINSFVTEMLGAIGAKKK